MPPEQRLSSAGATRAAAPQAAPMIGWFSVFLGLGSVPVGDLSAPHSSRVSDGEVGQWPLLSPGWTDTPGTVTAQPCCPPGSPFSAAVSNFFIYNFTEISLVLKSE